MVATLDDAAGEADLNRPVALCRAVKTRTSSGRGWALVVDRCPFCSAAHGHGGGTGARPVYGDRVSHCANFETRRAYELRPAGEAS